MSQDNNYSIESLKHNKKFIETVKTFVLYGAGLSLVNSFIGLIISSLTYSPYGMSHGAVGIVSLIVAIIIGAIVSAIGGAIFYFVYEPVHNWIKANNFLAKYIHSLFTLFWIPFIVITVISTAFGLIGMLGLSAVSMRVGGVYGGLGFGGIFLGFVVSLALNVFVYYFYSKMISKKLGELYSW